MLKNTQSSDCTFKKTGCLITRWQREGMNEFIALSNSAWTGFFALPDPVGPAPFLFGAAAKSSAFFVTWKNWILRQQIRRHFHLDPGQLAQGSSNEVDPCSKEEPTHGTVPPPTLAGQQDVAHGVLGASVLFGRSVQLPGFGTVHLPAGAVIMFFHERKIGRAGAINVRIMALVL